MQNLERGQIVRCRIYEWSDWENCEVVSPGATFVVVKDKYGIMHDVPNRFDRVRRPF